MNINIAKITSDLFGDFNYRYKENIIEIKNNRDVYNQEDYVNSFETIILEYCKSDAHKVFYKHGYIANYKKSYQVLTNKETIIQNIFSFKNSEINFILNFNFNNILTK